MSEANRYKDKTDRKRIVPCRCDKISPSQYRTRSLNTSILNTCEGNNAVDDQGRSALYYAVTNGHKEIVVALVTHGADQSLLHTAAEHEWSNIIEVLIDSGANFNSGRQD